MPAPPRLFKEDFNIYPEGQKCTTIPIFREGDKSYKSLEARRIFADFEKRLENEMKQEPLISNVFASPSLVSFSRYDDPRLIRGIGETDVWCDDLQRRFDNRRRQWNEDMHEMKNRFFIPMQSSDSAARKIDTVEQKPIITGYNTGADGRQCFVVRFEVRDFDPNAINLQLRNGQIIVKAFIVENFAERTSKREFTRSVELPKSVDSDAISAVITTDNWFVVTCPILQRPIQKVSYFDNDFKDILNSDNTENASISSLRSNYPVKEKSKNSLQDFDVEIPIGNDFRSEEILVKTLNNRVFVNARHEEKSLHRSAFREFSKEYDIPDNIDPKSISAKLEQGILYLSGLPWHE